jgi:hypothetical protein
MSIRTGQGLPKESDAMRSLILCVAVALGVLSSAYARAQVTTPACKGTRATKQQDGPWKLTCSGDCIGTKTCKSRSVTCNGVQLTACTCDGGTACPATNCCAVVLDDQGTPTTYGDCPSCSAMGACVICPNDPANPTQYQPVCGGC